MRFVFLFLAVFSQSVLADAYKCKSSSGQVVFTEKPCEVGHTLAGSSQTDHVDSHRAQADLNRQRGWLAGREQMHRQDAINAQNQASAIHRMYPQESPKVLKSESIFDKPWGCGNRSCPSVSSSPR